jgi:phosphatidylethanolamine/phosphatidyl-N-methylethanolamine N-methyltransferase
VQEKTVHHAAQETTMTSLLFLREFLVDPRQIGSVWPSNGKLAHRMASYLRCRPGEYLLELGPGTGTITQAILKQGLPPRRVVLIEKSERLTGVLRRRYQQVQVVHGDALELCREIRETLGTRAKVGTVISSLPLRNFDLARRQQLIEQIRSVLVKQGRYVQYTYALGASQEIQGFDLVHRERVWMNLPPATISVHQKN